MNNCYKKQYSNKNTKGRKNPMNCRFLPQNPSIVLMVRLLYHLTKLQKNKGFNALYFLLLFSCFSLRLSAMDEFLLLRRLLGMWW